MGTTTILLLEYNAPVRLHGEYSIKARRGTAPPALCKGLNDFMKFDISRSSAMYSFPAITSREEW